MLFSKCIRVNWSVNNLIQDFNLVHWLYYTEHISKQKIKYWSISIIIITYIYIICTNFVIW